MFLRKLKGDIAGGLCMAFSLLPAGLSLVFYTDKINRIISPKNVFIIMFFIAILGSAFIFLTEQAVEQLIIIILRKRALKYMIIYPFTYDGEIKFSPFSILKSQELFRGVIPINLIEGGMSKDEMKKHMMECIALRIISSIIVFTPIILFLRRWEVSIMTFVLILTSCLFYNFSSFMGKDSVKGFGYICRHNEEEKYFYSFPNIEKLNSSDYHKFLRNYSGEIDLGILDIAENYLLAGLMEDGFKTDIKLMEGILEKCNSICPTFVLLYDCQFLQLLHLVGLCGVKEKNEQLKNLCRMFLVEIGNGILSVGFSIDMINEYIDFLQGKVKSIKWSKHFYFGKYDMFSYRRSLETNAKRICG